MSRMNRLALRDDLGGAKAFFSGTLSRNQSRYGLSKREGRELGHESQSRLGRDVRPISVSACYLLSLLCLLGFPPLSQVARAGEIVYFRHDEVLGTSLDLKIEASTREKAVEIEGRILTEIERLRTILSTYDPQSEFSRWCRRTPGDIPVSAELFDVLALCDRYRDQSQGAFNASIQAVTRVWKDAEKENRMPTSAEILRAVEAASRIGWKLDAAKKTARRLTDGPFTLDALAKGYIVDRAKSAGLAAGAISVTVQIGGDLVVAGPASREIEIADPLADAENAPAISRVRLKNRALATSGGYRRGFAIGDRFYSHIIDPRNGQPAGQILGATVIASTCAEADALATIVSILPAQDSIALIESIPGAACLLVEQGSHRRLVSSRWAAFEVVSPISTPLALRALNPGAVQEKKDEKSAKDGKPWMAGMELTVQLEINRPANESRGYRRPYVALWVEDKDEFPVKTLALWLQTNGKGLRWLPDLKRWSKMDKLRMVVDETDLVRTVSSATRAPGKYKLVWDGKDDGGKPVQQGKYTLLLEAAREHGTYQMIKEEITIGEKPFSLTLKGNVEIKGATVDYKLKQGSR